jgi:Flp pilus assembly protein TadG
MMRRAVTRALASVALSANAGARSTVPMLRRLKASQHGAAAVEAALTLPTLFLFSFGIMTTGRAMWTQNALQYAVENAARCRAIDTVRCATDALTQTYAATQLVGITVASSDFVVSSPSCGKQVTVSYNFIGRIPGLGRNFNPALTATACHPV